MTLTRLFQVAVAGAALLLLAGSGSTPLMDPDESRFARTSIEMMRNGDLVVPHFNAEPRLAKPPLLHWIQSNLFRVLGPTEWVARLHAALATLGSILLAGWIARRRFGAEAAFWCAAVLATMPLVFFSGRLGTLDALLAVHVLAVIALDLAGPADAARFRAPAIGALVGLAFLVKGPVGVVLPCLILLAGRTASGRNVWPSLRGLAEAVAAWCAVVLPWGLALVQRVGVDRIGTTLRAEVFDRFFAGTAHVEPPWYYLQVVSVVFLPWLAPLIGALVRAWRLRGNPASRTAMYCGAAFVASVAFFSLSQGKLPSYVLPLAPLAAILVTWELGRELEAPAERGLVPSLLAASLAAIGVLLALGGGLRLEGAAERAAWTGAAIYGAGAAWALYGALAQRPRHVYGAAAASAAAFLGCTVVVLLPALAERKSAAPLIEAVPALASDRPVVTVEIKVPSLVHYLDRSIEVIDARELPARLRTGDRPLLVFADVDLPSLDTRTRGSLREIGRHAKFRVFEPRADYGGDGP